MYKSFGHKNPETSSSSIILRLLERQPKVSSISAKYLLNQAYEQEYGLFDHFAQAQKEKAFPDTPEMHRPLIAVEMKPGEDYVGASAAIYRFRRFKAARVAERTGMSWLEFLTLPTSMVEMILTEMEAESLKAIKAIDSDLSE